MDTINCIGAFGNMLMIFKELSKRVRTKIDNARKTDGIITLEDIGTVLKDFEDFMNYNLAQYNKEVKIDFKDNVPQQDPQEEANLVRRQSLNAWRMIYRLMDNVKLKMDNDYQTKGDNVTNQDVSEVIDYIYNAIKNITK